MDNPICWMAPEARRRESAMWAFSQQTAAMHGGVVGDYKPLLDWSIEQPEAFYQALWNALDIVGDMGVRAYRPARDLCDVDFYPEARLNYAENLLQQPDERLAIIAWRDDGTRRELTRAELYASVSRMIQALRAEGVVAGDRVAAIVTNDIEALTAYLATAAIGAIWASCSPDFGPVSAADRLCQITPKVLIAVSGYHYAGKAIDVSASLRAVAEGAALSRIVILGDAVPAGIAELPCITLAEWLAPFDEKEIVFTRLPFNAPLAILFSSGTTGKPKCIMHSAGGLLVQHKKEQQLHCDLRAGDRFFYFTTCGWMMWNWQVTGLASGATLVTYDGNPFYPKAEQLLDLIDAEQINVFGTSAKYIDACRKASLAPARTHRLDSLKTVLSTGSPLAPTSFDHIYQDWKADLHLASISGGTDICACFLGGNPLLPVRRGELQGAMLGMAIDVLDDKGQSLTDEAGELVCRNAHLSMPLGFWGDDSGERYRAAYFSRFPGLWAQGDYAEKKPSGGYVILGRSDTTLNPGGVRIGTSEIYRQVESMDEVEEALAVGKDEDGDQKVVLFIRLRDGVIFNKHLEESLRMKIRCGASPRHVPSVIIAVPAIPRTRSGKISELAVREVIHGREVKNRDALMNPESLDFFSTLAIENSWGAR